MAIFAAAPVAAPTVIDPTTAEFMPSPDHNTLVGGGPLLDHYELEIYQTGQTTAVRTVLLGKPAPESDGKIRVMFVAQLTPPLPSGAIYTADVVAVGPGGRASSAISI